MENKIARLRYKNRKSQQTCQQLSIYTSGQQSKRQHKNANMFVHSLESRIQGIPTNHVYNNIKLNLT